MAVDVISIDVVLEFMLVAVILINAVKEFAVKVGPLLKGIFLTEHTGADASGNQSRLNGKGSASAHRVNQVTFATPSGLQDDSRSQHLVERCLHSLLTVSTAVQTLTAAVQAQGTVILCHMNVQFYVGVYYSYVGTVASFLAELVHNGILYLVCHKLAVAKLVAEHHTIHGECGLVCQILRPVYRLYGIVHLFGCLGLEVLDRFQHTNGSTQLEVGSVHQFLVSCKGNHSPAYLDVVSSQFNQFCGQHILQSLKGFGDQFKFLHKYILVKTYSLIRLRA